MVEFRKFMTIWLATIVTISVFAFSFATMFNSPSVTKGTEKSHFSVVWKGFKPDYSNQFPDYCICINNLKDESLRMYVQLKIENYENMSLYFMVDQYAVPPSGWYAGPQYLGLVAITNPIMTFTYSNLNRTKPVSIPEGSLHESVELTVKSYYDSGYTQFYSQANFTANFHFIDVTAPVWTKFIYYNFDDGTTQGWSGNLHSWTYYRSWPSSIGGIPSKTIDLIGNYTEGYLVAAAYMYPISPTIYLDSVVCFKPDIPSGTTAWHQIAIPLPVNKATYVSIYSVSYVDDAYVLAK